MSDISSVQLHISFSNMLYCTCACGISLSAQTLGVAWQDSVADAIFFILKYVKNISLVSNTLLDKRIGDIQINV